MVKVFVMIGVQGSGKSTMAKFLAAQENAVIVSTDEIRKQLMEQMKMPYEHTPNNVVFARFFATAKSLARQGKNVIMDATNINAKYRKGIFQNLAGFDCEFIGCVMQTDKETCLQRTRQREKTDVYAPKISIQLLDRFIAIFGFPTIAEGFNEIRLFDSAKQNEIYRTEPSG